MFILLSYANQDHIPRGGTAHRELSSPTAIINHENAPLLQTCIQVNLKEVFSQLKFHFPDWVKLKKKNLARRDKVDGLQAPPLTEEFVVEDIC